MKYERENQKLAFKGNLNTVLCVLSPKETLARQGKSHGDNFPSKLLTFIAMRLSMKPKLERFVINVAWFISFKYY